MLQDIKFKGVYRSETDNLFEDFYLPALKEATAYDRAVGFFSAAMLSYAAQGLSALLEKGGQMRLVFGGAIESDEADAIEDGYIQRKLSAQIRDQILQVIENIADGLVHYRLRTMAWMIANGHLDIKVALKPQGMYHEKIGIFTDSIGDRVVFQGSANETVYALSPDFNFESINVFPSWRAELADHSMPYIDGFERLWANKTKNTVVLAFPDAARERLIQIAKRSPPPRTLIERDLWRRLYGAGEPPFSPTALPHLPATLKGSPFEMRPHQLQALNCWKAQGLQGIFAMATGSGKTITAIYGVVRLLESLHRVFVLIAVPYQALADQWVEELAQFEIQAIRCYESVGAWADEFSQAVSLFEAGALKFAACVVVNRTLQSDQFQQRLRQLSGSTLVFIGDECHYHSAVGLYDSLPRQARVRLGLSATPEHYFNEELTTRLKDYYGQIAFTYSLADALRDEVLTPYRYYLHFVDLTEMETEEYADLSSAISRLAAGQRSSDVESSEDGPLKSLLFRRARLLGNAETKLVALSLALSAGIPAPFHLFYCGDGTIEGDDDGESLRQVDLVSGLLGGLGWKVSHFTSRQSRDDRRKILDGFRIGLLDGLVAIRCLDEGIDVPDCRTAYILASSRNPKQFIQRRGRILRRSPGKEFATIHDFVVRIPHGLCEQPGLERDLLVAELKRITEFGGLALNRGEVFRTLEPILDRYDLHHHFV